MERFLQKVASSLLDTYGDHLGNVLVVFNNHRSELFLQREFSRLSSEGRSFFLPHTMVIDDLIAQLGGLRIVPHEFLLFELYSIHIELGGEERKYQTFEEFIPFGEMMLGDFSEIDRYCVDAHDLFVNLHDLKAIGEWDIESPNLTDFQRSYLAFYHSLHDYYLRLRTRLQTRGEAYGGMAYRNVAEHADSMISDCPYEGVWFVGFNALSECERRIIGAYMRQGVGHLMTDADAYYYFNPQQEAGYFLRKHREEFPELEPRDASCFAQGMKHITVVECPENVLQCKYTGALLRDHPEWFDEAESTAVVLADESLLVPTLNALPDRTMGVPDYDVNISMGYAFSDSKTHQLVLKLIDLYRNRTAKGYHRQDILAVLSDYIITKIHEISNLYQQVSDWTEKENRVRCMAEEISQILDSMNVDTELSAVLFPEVEPTVDTVLDTLRRLTALVATKGLSDDNKKERQALGALVEVLDYLDELQHEYQYITNIDTLEKVYTKIAQRHSISFIGKPLTGLQMLGMLETRNLDFRRIILLSANEGVLPSGRGNNTLIPYELKRHFGLPTYEEQDNIYAYHFYRLLQRADEVYLLFSSESEAMGKGEASRFIKQIRSELHEAFPNHITLDEVVVNPKLVDRGDTPELPAAKTPLVQERLKVLAQKGFSPTSLNSYVNCPLKYYYTYVLSVWERDELEDDLDASQLGNCVHNVLWHVYQPFEGRQMEVGAIEDALERLPELLDKEFNELFAHGRNDEGRNRFLYSVAESQLRALFGKELKLLKEGNRIDIVSVEKELTYTMGDGVVLSGRVDRVDRLNGVLRIIDYKTGSLKAEEIAAKGTAEADMRLPGKWLQLMCYALTYRRHTGTTEPILSGIYPLSHLQSEVKVASWNGETQITPAMTDDFEALLRGVIDEIMNPELPFLPGKRPLCAHCPAHNFCPYR